MPENLVAVTNPEPSNRPLVVSGTVTTVPSGTTTVAGTVTANQGTAAATANAWPMKISNGTSTADLAPASPSALGNALLVTGGVLTASTTLSAASAVSNGTAVDYGSAKSNFTLVVVASAGVSAGVVALEVSHDGTNWYRHTTTVTTSAPGVSQTTMTGFAFRHARGVITTTITGGTVTCTLMSSS